MNGLTGIGAIGGAANQTSAADLNTTSAQTDAASATNASGNVAQSDFDAILAEQMTKPAAAIYQFIGSDIVETVLKGEDSVD